MKWEYLGEQELRYGVGVASRDKGHLFRTKVPGGWFIMFRIETAFSFVPVSFFYPDPDHTWDGSDLEYDAETLLRPA